MHSPENEHVEVIQNGRYERVASWLAQSHESITNVANKNSICLTVHVETTAPLS